MTNGNLGELAAALAKAQAAFPRVLKDRTAKIASTKGEYSYKYADLASLLDAVRKPLSDNGLALTQPIEITDKGMVLHTMLLHSSGTHLDSYYALATHDRPQEMGSEITYSRRYTAGSILGIASEEDDDGAAAQHAAVRHSAFRGAPKMLPGAPEGGGMPAQAPEETQEEAARLFSTPADDTERTALVADLKQVSDLLKLTTIEKVAMANTYLGNGVTVAKAGMPDLAALVDFLRSRTGEPPWAQRMARVVEDNAPRP